MNNWLSALHGDFESDRSPFVRLRWNALHPPITFISG